MLLSATCHFAGAQSFNSHLATALQNRLDSMVTLFPGTKGMSAAVYCPGQGIWTGASGESHSGQPITTGMEFGIASNSKIFTAALLLKLAEGNVLHLDDSLHQWLPTYPNIHPDITIRQLLNHTSGVSDPFFTTGLLDTIELHPMHVYSPEEVLSWVGPPQFAPGASSGYSNINYILAGMVAESATGMPIAQLIRDSLLSPLQLDSTFYDVEETVLGVIAHRWHQGVDFHDTSRVALNTSGGPAGSLFSTSGEMVQWYHALLGGQVLQAGSLAEMTTFVNPGDYGLGINRQPFFDNECWGHGGSTFGYTSRMIYDPCRQAAVCGISNSDLSAVDGITAMLYKLLVDSLPGCAGAISGAPEVCQGQTGVTFTTPAILHATSYSWTLPGGATGTSATNSITLDFGAAAASGEISVRGTNLYGGGAASVLAVQVLNQPATPVIALLDDVLHSDAPAGNQWYNQDGPIAGATGQDYTISETGYYYARVTLSGCVSDSSNLIYFTPTGTQESVGSGVVRVYPNPVSNELNLEAGDDSDRVFFEILNGLGQLVSKGSFSEKHTISTGHFAPGVYWLKIENGRTPVWVKLLKEQ